MKVPKSKRCFDVLLSLCLLVLLTPLLILTVLVVRFCIGGPVLFRQKRPGFQEVPFYLLKFRTMTDARDDRGHLLPDAKRLTKLGRLLRATSLDELPELFNVVKGEMSLVGPRPLLMQYLGRYSDEQRRRHDVLPGITGWAQINGRNNLNWEERFKQDVWYVDHWSFSLDLKILLRTLIKVVKREDISAEGYATMPEFKGTE